MPLDKIRLCFLGFGSANQALARMLIEKSETYGYHNRLRIEGSSYGFVDWTVCCIITKNHGLVCLKGSSYYGDTSIDLELALKLIESGGILDNTVVTHCGKKCQDEQYFIDYDSFIRDGARFMMDGETETERIISYVGKNSVANIVVEAIPSNPKGDGEPAISYIKAALKAKMHVVSANKSPLAHCSDNKETYWVLQNLANSIRGKNESYLCDDRMIYKHESAVMDGVPIFSFWKGMPHAKLISIRGCLNSTTTMIITRMEGNLDDNASCKAETFEEALAAAKQMGIVEEDESLDVDGYDAAAKLRALLVVLTHPGESKKVGGSRSTLPPDGIYRKYDESSKVPTMDEIHIDSITNITREDISRAYANGKKKYRLVASAKLVDASASTSNDDDENTSIKKKAKTETTKWEASVSLQLVDPSDPLYNLTGTDSSVQFCTDVLGPITIASSNPTLVDTAYGLYSDIVSVAMEVPSNHPEDY